MKPVIKIRYARAMDRYCEALSKSDWKEPYQKIMGDLPYPNKEQLIAKAKEYEKAWSEVEDQVIQALNFLFSNKVFGVVFYEKEIPVYIVGFGRAHSDPLVIPSNFKPEEFVSVLIHELIHRLLSFNPLGVNEDDISPKLFPNESENVAVHVVVHAILSHIYLDVLNDPNMLSADIGRAQGDYAKAWSIVKENGHEKIIEMFGDAIKVL